MTDICVICLDIAKDKDALYLLQCGCKAAWFHLHCENQWIDSTLTPLTCPTCRRIPLMITNYAFHYSVGTEQKILWFTYSASLLHGLFLAFFVSRWFPESMFLIMQNGWFLLTPFLFQTSFTNNWYLFHSRVFIFYTTVAILLGYSFWKSRYILFYEFSAAYYTIHILSFFHFLAFSLLVILESCSPYRPKVDPWIPYAISREVLHANIQYALVSSESTSRSAEGDEAGSLALSRGTADTLRRSQRLTRNHRG